MGVVRVCGLLSLRMGEVFLEVRGLVPAEEVVANPPDKRFRNGGAVAVVGVVMVLFAVCEEDLRVSLVLRRGAELLAVVMLWEDSGVAAGPAEAELAPPWSRSGSSGLLLAMAEVQSKQGGSVLFAHHPRRRSAGGRRVQRWRSCVHGRSRMRRKR